MVPLIPSSNAIFGFYPIDAALSELSEYLIVPWPVRGIGDHALRLLHLLMELLGDIDVRPLVIRTYVHYVPGLALSEDQVDGAAESMITHFLLRKNSTRL